MGTTQDCLQNSGREGLQPQTNKPLINKDPDAVGRAADCFLLYFKRHAQGLSLWMHMFVEPSVLERALPAGLRIDVVTGSPSN